MFDMLLSEHISNGAYGSVFGTLLPNIVAKSAPKDPAWAYWVAFCIQFQDESPLLPRVYMLHCRPDGTQATALMEKLQPEWRRYYVECPMSDYYEQEQALNELPEQAREIVRLFISFVRSECEIQNNFRLDAHCDNWMDRKGQLVLTDPVAGDLQYHNPPMFQHPRIKCFQPYV